MTQGYFLIALGEYYIHECAVLAQTIRKSGDTRPISLLIHPSDEDYARTYPLFDQLVYFTPDDDLWRDCTTGFEKYCLYPRIYLNEYLPYDENITVDSDVICQYNPDHVWRFCSSRSSPIVMLGRHDDPNWHWGSINEVSEKYGKHVPHVHGGFFYLRKQPTIDPFFDYCKEVFYKYDEYGCKRQFRGGKVDEIIFAIAHSHFGMLPVAFDEYPIMTFNYTSDIEIPSRLQTEGGQNVYMTHYIPFVHMFDKMQGMNFQSLFYKVMA